MATDIEDLLPDRDIDEHLQVDDFIQAEADRAETKHKRKLNAGEIARLKYRERRINKIKEDTEGFESKVDYNRAQRDITKQDNMTIIKRVEDMTHTIRANNAFIDGVTPIEVVKLLNKLNVNLNVKLTKNDTYNLLATLLTCNEKQLNALLANGKVPIAIKIVIKRLLSDAEVGNITTIERLWDRIFGQGKLGFLDSFEGNTQNGILPNKPVSREAYVIIRETLLGKND